MMTTMEIQEFNNEDLIKNYVELNKQKEMLVMQQSIIKDVLKERMEKDKLEKIDSSFGEAKMMNQTRRNFMQASAKKFLTDEQIKTCYRETELSFIRILSTETKAKMKF